MSFEKIPTEREPQVSEFKYWYLKCIMEASEHVPYC